MYPESCMLLSAPILSTQQRCLLVQSFFRDWMIGEASRRSFLPSFVYSATAFRVGALVFGLVYLLSGRKHGGDLLSLAPLFMGSGSESAQCSILFYHQDASGRYADRKSTRLNSSHSSI